MAVAAAVYGGYPPSKFRPSSPSPPRIAALVKPNPTPPPPVFISTNPAHVNLHHLRDLYAICNHSCHRFPTIDAAGRVEPVDALKLLKALSHSPVVVSVFTKPEFLTTQSSASPEVTTFTGIGGDWIRKVAPVTPESGRLIGFGRAVSDLGLTASIYDVMHDIIVLQFLQVHPALQGRGIGRMIVQRIIRTLTNRGIYDIAALCTDNQRHFFRACGFGDDMLGSITMMYTRSSSGYSKDEQMISAGRKQLLVPPLREFGK
ncbi:UNVERIFIED_CONTAM: Histone acetyltransferase TAP1 [Sesamum radiatum]|uniref:Histone acetyltransferase TAP1 n=1 Tax=Sesamum radiatum TaxID=300843 RepID=A0AAW2KC20_SESRA